MACGDTRDDVVASNEFTESIRNALAQQQELHRALTIALDTPGGQPDSIQALSRTQANTQGL